MLGADPPTPSWQASGWMLGLGVTLPHPRRVCGRGVLEGDAFWGAEEGGWVMLGGVGVWAGLGCREALPPSSLAHPTILLLLLLLSPVLNSVATATMSTTFQLPRDGLRRGGKRGAKGRGGGGGRWARAACHQGGDTTRDRGHRPEIGAWGDASQMGFFPTGSRLASGGRCQPGVCQGVRAGGPTLGKGGSIAAPPSSEQVGGYPQNLVPVCSHPACARAPPVPGMSVAAQLGGGCVNYSQTPPSSSFFFFLAPPRSVISLFLG